eukprot:841959-Pelagomonas_calceolata.AAC.1
MLFIHKFTHKKNTPASPASNSASPPLPPLEAVLKGQHKNIKEQINTIDSDYSTHFHIRAQRCQQIKIAKHPALANKEIFNGKSTTPPQIKVLTDRNTGEMEKVWLPLALKLGLIFHLTPKPGATTPGWTDSARTTSS